MAAVVLDRQCAEQTSQRCAVANDWFCDLALNRPVYDCPNCKQLAMQFFAEIPGEPGRTDSFRCCVCGSTWEL